MDEVTSVENFFKSHQVHMCRVWLESCINWCKEENLLPNYTLKDLQCNVFEQWLILDLRDVEVACLPPNLSSQENFILSDNYALQLMQVVDISKPKYWQLQRIRTGVPKNLEQELESAKRVLQLTLTDGVQEIVAIEYKPIKCLNLNLSPGKKIRLMGPIQIRRGRVMLEERHIKVVGGEVDTLLVENAAENIIAKYLNQPLNPKPEGIQESILIENLNEDNNVTGVSSVIQNQSTTNIQRNRNIPQNHSIGGNILTNNTNISKNQMNSTSTTTITKKPPPPIDNFDDLDDELLMEVEQEFEKYSNSNKSQNTHKTVTETKSRSPDMFDDMDLILQGIEIPPVIDTRPSTSKKQSEISNFFDKPKGKSINNSSSKKQSKSSNFFDKPKEKLINNSKQNDEVINISDSLDLDCFISQDILNVNKTEENCLPPKPVIWPVDKLLKTIPNVTNGKFKIKAKFKSVIEKMTFVNNKFNLVVEVGDGTGNITLKIHNDVVVELIGISEVVFMEFKDGFAKNVADAQKRFLEALKSLQTRLLALDNVLEVLVNVNETFPVLVKIL